MSVKSGATFRGHRTYVVIDAMRFVAALMVVTTHSAFYAAERLNAPQLQWPQGVRGVDLFFVISGFVMYVSGARLAEQPRGWSLFIERRLIRIVPLYWLVTTIKLAALLSTSKLVLHAKFDPVAIVSSYLFLPSYNVDGRLEPLLGVGWTLNFEMVFYAIFAIAIAARRHLAFNVVAVLVLLALASLGRPSEGPAILFYLNPIVLEFGFGIVIAVLLEKAGRPTPPVAAALFIVGMGLLLSPVVDGLPKVVGCGMPAALAIYAVCSVEDRLGPRVPRVLVFLGASSYSLYLVHPLIAPIVPTVLNMLGIHAALLSIVGSIALALLVSSIVFVLVERPLSAAIRHRLAGRTARREPPAKPLESG